MRRRERAGICHKIECRQQTAKQCELRLPWLQFALYVFTHSRTERHVFDDQRLSVQCCTPILHYKLKAKTKTPQ